MNKDEKKKDIKNIKTEITELKKSEKPIYKR